MRQIFLKLAGFMPLLFERFTENIKIVIIMISKKIINEKMFLKNFMLPKFSSFPVFPRKI